MAQASRDQNFVPTLLAVSSVDGVTPVPVYANPTTHRLLVDIPSGSGTVTDVSVVSANGFAGTVATSTTTPAITLSTSITGILKGNGTAISAVTIGSGLSYDGTTLSATGSGTGDVTGPASSTDEAIVRFDGATGKIIQNYTSGAPTISDTGAITATQGGSLTGTWSNLGTVTTIDINGGSIDGATIGAASASTIVGTTITANTGFMPDANDGAYLGQSGTAFSDLFLASGGVINWDAGNIILTHSSGALTISNTDNNADGPILELYQNSATPAANDDVGELRFFGNDSAANKQEYARIEGTIVDPTSTTEAGKLTMWVSAAGSMTAKLDISNSSMQPTTNDGMALGGTANQFSDLFLAEGGVINWDNGDVTMTQTGNVLAVAGGDLQVATAGVGTNADSVPTLSSTSTFTNKRITKRTGTTTSSATPTINTDNVDFYSITAQTVDITSFTTNLSGTPTEGQTLWIAITGTAARAITWGSSFEASTVALPTTTVSTNRLDVGFIWNSVTSKWRCIASA